MERPSAFDRGRSPARPRPSARARGQALSSVRLAEALWRLVAVAGLAYVLVFCAVALARMLFPYPLNRMEELSLQAVLRIWHGQSVYAPPGLDYVPPVYPPGYFYLAALVALLTGPGFLALRLVSVLATGISLLLVYGFVRRETGRAAAGLAAAGLLAASFPHTDYALDLGRVDALFLCLLLAALWLARFGSGWRAASASGVVLGLSVLTKQTGLLAAAGVLGYFAVAGASPTRLAGRRVGVLACGLALAATLGLAAAALTLQAGGWPWVYIWEWPARHTLSPRLMIDFWMDDLLPRYTIPLLLGPVFLLTRPLQPDQQRRTTLFYLFAAGILLGVTWTARANPGGVGNTLLPVLALLGMLFGLGLHTAYRLLSEPGRPLRFRLYLMGLATLELVQLLYNPRLVVPGGSAALAGERLTTTIAALPGAVFAPDFGAYSRLADRGEQPHVVAAEEMAGVFGRGPDPQYDDWRAALVQALQERRYRYVLLEDKSDALFLLRLLWDNGYVSAGQLFPEGDQFWLWHGTWVPGVEVYVPQEAAQ